MRLLWTVLLSLVACATAPQARTVTAPPAASSVIEPTAPITQCDSPGTIEHVVERTHRYLQSDCATFMPAFDEFIELGCVKALPDLAHAVGTLRELMDKESWYDSVDRPPHQPSGLHAQARLRVASIAWSMMPARCQSHVPRPMNEEDTNVSIARVDSSWRECYPDDELLLTHFDKPDRAGDVTVLAYVFAVAMEPYMTSVGHQFLRQSLACNAQTNAEDPTYRPHGW